MLPAGIVAPVNEKPITVPPAVDKLNPFASALPPETASTLTPDKVNWKPAIGNSLFILISIVPDSKSTSPQPILYPG